MSFSKYVSVSKECSSTGYGIGSDFTAAAWAAGFAVMLLSTDTPEPWRPTAHALTLIHVFLASAYGTRALTNLIWAAGTSKKKSIDSDVPAEQDNTL